ncbi:MAG: hypothetical protein MJZ16_04725, partial [Bacteroidales bacterium]|nr:hypothetical protein [Bacteroidales bacterium]
HLLEGMGFRRTFGWRPMLMVPYKGQKSSQVGAQKATLILYPLVRLLRNYNTMKEMCSAIISVTLNGYMKPYISPSDIIKISKDVNK